ncbi:MAG: ATPase [Bacteroidetes bacterium]|nr:ATPase [Bacteroidota bacterium]
MSQENPTQFNYLHLLNYLQFKGKERFGQSFYIRKEDVPLILKLLYYFTNNEEKAKEHDIDLTKGIMLSGPIGCGKTTLLELMKLIAVPEKKYLLTTSREISFELIQDGFEVIQRYSKGITGQQIRRNIAFDDLGTERNLKYYGNECNIMAEILLSRYELFCLPDPSRRVVTHITTNLSATELEEYYGNRVRSRLRSMCNLIAFDKETADKR